MFARLTSSPFRRLATRAAMATGAVAGLCALADQGARHLGAGAPARVAVREARPADPVTTGSIRQVPVAPAPAQPAATGEGLDRRGLAVLVSSGAANAVAAPPAKRKPEPAAARPR